MGERLILRLAGPPRGKGRARTTLIRPKGRAPFVSTYPEPETAMYESHLRLAAQDAMEGRPLYSGPLYVCVFAYFPLPASWSRRKRVLALAGAIRPGKPDWENIAKVTDALNGVVWGDDAQVAEGFVRKAYSEQPELVVTVEPCPLLEALPAAQEQAAFALESA